jgi:hypothetical protein
LRRIDVLSTDPLYDDPIARSSERLRDVVGRSLIYGLPVFAATCVLTIRAAVWPGQIKSPGDVWLVLVHLAVAVLGPAVGVAVLRGRLSVKLAGSFAYSLLGFIVYIIILANFSGIFE